MKTIKPALQTPTPDQRLLVCHILAWYEYLMTNYIDSQINIISPVNIDAMFLMNLRILHRWRKAAVSSSSLTALRITLTNSSRPIQGNTRCRPRKWMVIHIIPIVSAPVLENLVHIVATFGGLGADGLLVKVVMLVKIRVWCTPPRMAAALLVFPAGDFWTLICTGKTKEGKFLWTVTPDFFFYVPQLNIDVSENNNFSSYVRCFYWGNLKQQLIY